MKTIDLGDLDGTSLSVINVGYKQLCYYRDTQDIPSDHLLEDIKVYEYILNDNQSHYKAEEYMHMRRYHPEIKKRMVADMLGWDINY